MSRMKKLMKGDITCLIIVILFITINNNNCYYADIGSVWTLSVCGKLRQYECANQEIYLHQKDLDIVNAPLVR